MGCEGSGRGPPGICGAWYDGRCPDGGIGRGGSTPGRGGATVGVPVREAGPTMDGAPGCAATGRGGAGRATGRGWTGAFGSSIRSRIEGGIIRPNG
jgi:hypothetical protein